MYDCVVGPVSLSLAAKLIPSATRSWLTQHHSLQGHFHQYHPNNPHHFVVIQLHYKRTNLSRDRLEDGTSAGVLVALVTTGEELRPFESAVVSAFTIQLITCVSTNPYSLDRNILFVKKQIWLKLLQNIWQNVRCCLIMQLSISLSVLHS